MTARMPGAPLTGLPEAAAGHLAMLGIWFPRLSHDCKIAVQIMHPWSPRVHRARRKDDA